MAVAATRGDKQRTMGLAAAPAASVVAARVEWVRCLSPLAQAPRLAEAEAAEPEGAAEAAGALVEAAAAAEAEAAAAGAAVEVVEAAGRAAGMAEATMAA